MKALARYVQICMKYKTMPSLSSPVEREMMFNAQVKGEEQAKRWYAKKK